MAGSLEVKAQLDRLAATMPEDELELVLLQRWDGLTHAEIPKASTTMNIVRQVGGSVATALFAVVLERQIVTQLGPAATKAGGSTGVISTTRALPPQVADPVAAAFAHTFWWAIGAILIAFVPTLFLRNHAAVAAAAASDDGKGDGDGDGAGPGTTPIAGAMID